MCVLVWHMVQDCLACSGCVTSAETVLLEHQSTAEFLVKLAEPGATVVVTLSPQSRAALAAFYGLPPGETQARLAGFLKGLGVRAVLDASAGRDFALLEAAAEFVERYRAAHPKHTGGSHVAHCQFWQSQLPRHPSLCASCCCGAPERAVVWAEPPHPCCAEPAGPSPMNTAEDAATADERLSSGQGAGPSGRAAEHANGVRQHGRRAGGGGESGGRAAGGNLPMLASACPGWVCYAEKTHGSYILPHISTTKSPQVCTAVHLPPSMHLPDSG